MDRHTNSFFSDVDVARFAKGRIFLGDPYSDGEDRSKAALVSSVIANDVEKLSEFYVAARILPTAEEHQCIREEEERRELHRRRVEGEPVVTVDSLPYVYGISSEGIEQQRRQQEDANYLANGNMSVSCAIGHSGLVRPDEFVGNMSGEEVNDETNEKRYVPANVSARTCRMYSDQSQSDGEDSSEDESDDGSIIFPNDVGALNAGNKAEAIPTTGRHRNNSRVTSEKAIGIESSVWHSRRSESEVVLSRIKRTRQRSLLKRQRSRSISAAATANALEDETVQRRRSTLRFAAAPVAVNKRKKQRSLKDMFKL
ncbi:hypothetical protein ACHAW5_002921 [Stephanodiscus triporus]|uniref:Uncharacterized protein n=1 Tax=Stephanodiscus triporus TaxID=2934178 RepID=A0ABD3MZN2_9STRA